MERLAKMMLVMSLLVFSVRSAQSKSDPRAEEEILLNDIKEGLEKIDLQLMRLLDIVAPPTTTPATSTPEPLASSTTTTDSLATTTDSSATTTDSLATTTDSSATTTDSSATTTDSSATTTDSSATTTDSSATTTDSSATTTDSSATTTDSSAITTDSSATTNGSSATTPDSSATTPDSSATTNDSSATTIDSVVTTNGSSATSMSPSINTTTDSALTTKTPVANNTTASFATMTTDFSANTSIDPTPSTTPSSNRTANPSSSGTTDLSSSGTTGLSSSGTTGLSSSGTIDLSSSGTTDLSSNTTTGPSTNPSKVTTKAQADDVTSGVKGRGKRSIEVKQVGSTQGTALAIENTTTPSSAICRPNDPDKKDDLCARLLEVLNGVENVTREVSSGRETEDTLKEVKAYEEELRQVVGLVETDPTFSESLDRDVLVSDVTQLRQDLDEAETKLDEKLVKLNKVSPLLLIVLGSVGGAILLALAAVSGFAVHKKKKLRLEDELRKINATNIPVQSFKEVNGYVNPSFQQDSPRGSGLEQCPPPTLIPRPRSSIESHGHREPYTSFDTKSLPNDSRLSSDPRGPAAGGKQKTPSPYYSVPRPLGEPRHDVPHDSRGRRLSGRSDEEDLHDPYSLEGRGHNVRRIHSGRLMRVEP